MAGQLPERSAMMKSRTLSLILLMISCLLFCLVTPSLSLSYVDATDYQGNGRIVFVSDRDGNDEIYSMEADGSDVQRLTYNDSIDFYPTWAPYGDKIAFSSTRDGLVFDIFTMDADGANPFNVTNRPDASDMYPAWSPDGTQIAFSRLLEGSSSIYIINADGSGLFQVVDGNGQSLYMPTWSPDGTEIMFTSADEPPQVGFEPALIEKVKADGSERTQIMWIEINGNLDWSWVNNTVAYYNAAIYLEIYSMNPDGTNINRITPLPEDSDTFYKNPAWSPDGTQIVFQGSITGDENIYIVDVETREIINITSEFDSDDKMPDWQPILNRIN
jgi:TolB protein